MKIDDIAKKIISFNPERKFFDHVIIGVDEPMHGSTHGITWRDIQKLAEIALKKESE